MIDPPLARYLAAIILVGVVSCATLRRRPTSEFGIACIRMTGLAGLLNELSAAVVLIFPPSSCGTLFRVLVGMDGLLLAVGAILATRPSPKSSGAGVAVVAQALLRLILDVCFWRQCD